MRFTIKLSLLLVLFGIHSSNCLNCTAFWQNYKDKIPGAKNLNTYTSSSVTGKIFCFSCLNDSSIYLWCEILFNFFEY